MYAAIFQLPSDNPSRRFWVFQVLDERHAPVSEPEYFPSMALAKHRAEREQIPFVLTNTQGEQIYFNVRKRRGRQ